MKGGKYEKPQLKGQGWASASGHSLSQALGAHYSYSNASPSTPVCIRLRDQSLTYAPGTHACHKAVYAPPRLFNVVWPAFHIDLPAVDISQPLSRTYKSVSVKQFK